MGEDYSLTSVFGRSGDRLTLQPHLDNSQVFQGCVNKLGGWDTVRGISHVDTRRPMVLVASELFTPVTGAARKLENLLRCFMISASHLRSADKSYGRQIVRTAFLL